MSLKVLAAAALLLTGAPAPALADTAGEAMVRAFVADLDARADWSASASSIRAEGDWTVAEGLFVAVGGEGPKIGIGRMAIDGLRARAGGGFVAGAMRLEGTAIVVDDSTASIPLIEVEGMALPDLTALAVEPDAPLSFIAGLYSALAETEIERLAVPSLAVTGQSDGAGGVEWQLRVSSLSLLGLSRGLIQALDAGPTVSETRNEGEVGRTEIASFESRLIGIDAVARLLDPDRYEGGRGDGIWRPALGSLVYAGIRAADDEGVLTVDRIALGNVDLRQPETPFAPVVERLARNDALTSDEALTLVRSFLPGLLHAFRVGEMRLEGLAFEESDEAADAPSGGRLDRFALTGISAAGIDRIDLRGLDATGPEAAVALASFHMAGLAFPELEAFLTLVELGEASDEAGMQERIGELVAGLIPKIDRAGFDGLSIEADGVGPITIDRYLAEVGAYVGAIPVTSRMVLTGLTIPGSVLEADADAAELFGGLGIDSLTFDLSGESIWAEEGRYETELSLAARDLASVRLKADLLGVTEGWLRRYMASPASSAEQALTLFGELQLSGLALALSDDTLVERILGLLAQQQGAEAEAYRAELSAALPFFLTMIVGDPMLRTDIAEALRSFLQGGRSLILALEPPRPLAIADIVATAQIQPEGLPTLLGTNLRTGD